MVDETTNNNKTLTIVAISFIGFLAYLAYRNRNISQQPLSVLSTDNKNIKQLEDEIRFLKEQLHLTQEKLEDMSQFNQYKQQENKKMTHYTPVRKLDDNKENKIRQQIFDMQ